MQRLVESARPRLRQHLRRQADADDAGALVADRDAGEAGAAAKVEDRQPPAAAGRPPQRLGHLFRCAVVEMVDENLLERVGVPVEERSDLIVRPRAGTGAASSAASMKAGPRLVGASSAQRR